jgi:hypothetical protein
MFDRLNKHLQGNNVLAPEQFGFRKGIAIEKAVFTLTDNILTALNPKKQVGGIFCDLAKASDCVNHEILLCKLFYYVVCGVNAQWLESHLIITKQMVEIMLQN